MPRWNATAGRGVKREHKDFLRRLALSDEAVLESLVSTPLADTEPRGLDAKTVSLVRLAALISLDSAPVICQWSVDRALAAGATDVEVVAVLTALVPFVGTVRVNSAAPDIASAMGFDLEVHDDR